jgi:hypothetical protein
VRLERAEAAARESDWAAVGGHLEGVEGRHAQHLRGMALLHLGRLEEALAELRTAAPEGYDACRLDAWAEVVEALRDEGAPAEGGSWARQLVSAIRAADGLLARGDAAAACEVLDSWPVWKAQEAQSLGRLAAALLAREPADPVGRFRKHLGLAAFLEALEARDALQGHNLPLGPLGWSVERLEEVAARARGWLEAVQGRV